MEGLLLTQSGKLIIGQIAWLLGKLMNAIYNFFDSVLNVQNIGLCIIVFTIIIYTFMVPLVIKQQKFQKVSAVMNPEIQKIQKKYAGKRDMASQQKIQEETQLVYEKYGTSPTGGCSSMAVQFALLFGLYPVIQNIPAYVERVKNAYMPLVDGIMATEGFEKIFGAITKAKPVMMDPERFDFTQSNYVIDALYKFQNATWDTLADKMPGLNDLIYTTEKTVNNFNNFFGLNIGESPFSTMMTSFKAGAIGLAIVALMIPILSGLTQYISIQISMKANGNGGLDENSQMASTMKTMNTTMPLFSVFMCFTLPAGLGLYWIASAVVRCIQQVFINKVLEKKSVDDLIAENRAKMKKKIEKKGVKAEEINAMARTSTKSIQPKKSELTEEERAFKLQKAAEANKNAKAGSLAAKANMVRDFNESNK